LVHSESHATTAEAHESIEAVERFVEHVDAAAHRTIDGGGG
jgi:hypothetical protein